MLSKHAMWPGAALLCAAFLLSACAFNVISILQVPARFEPVAGLAETFVLAADINVPLREGHATRLRKDTKWAESGRIAQGMVLHTDDQTVTVTASNEFEADLVVSNRMITGFYLPVEHTFAPADPPVAFNANQPHAAPASEKGN